MTTRRRTKRHAKPRVWLAVIALVAAVFLIGDDHPQLRQVLEALLQDFVSDKPPANRQAGNVEVIDGYTIDVAGSRVRLYGIDAPEAAQTCQRDGRTWACGTIAENSLVSTIAGRQVRCEEQDIDRYGRSVATCWAGEENLNAWMVENGWAVAYRQYGGAIYDPEEAVARAARRGIWSSEFVMPWDWRESRR
ncbi:thermonuclease family protein [Paracoccus sp. PAMC 22219]|uniref:thermonuclease family protein n=1 Tax=Paracoccus sp. PAMC 22219 TaxID=1569209 RepID=UPI0009E00F25|nr:thermonuclease family protein [Paracoccus sp. PAMC 22219]